MNNNDLIMRGDALQELDSFLAEVEEKMLSICKQYGACANRATTNCEKITRGSVNNIRERINSISAVHQQMSAVEYLIAESRWRTWCESKFAPRSKTYATCVDVFCEYADDKCAQCKLSPQERVAFIERWVKDHPEEVEE